MGMTAALRLATRRALDQLPPRPRPRRRRARRHLRLREPAAGAAALRRRRRRRARRGLSRPPGLPGTRARGRRPVKTVIGGDARCASVAAASVLAKVTRDRIMRATADSYPAFDFERNKGYPSPAHQRALCGYGLSAVHRRSWAFVDYLPWELTSWPGDYRTRNSRLDGGLLGQPEHPLADDVVEDLVGSAGDAHPG